MNRLEVDEEKDGAGLFRNYKRSDEESKEMSSTERYIGSHSPGRSRQSESSSSSSLPEPATLWIDDISNRVGDVSAGRLQKKLLSITSPGSRKRLQRKFAAAFGSFLIFLKPSFLELWTNDKPKKLHPTAYLDGLRGVAALFVVFHHYACQFTPALLEGWGTEHDNYWLLQLPFLRISHNGTLMVEIFFVLSGFVLSVKALRLARQGRQQEFANSLASSAFRRWFRLAIPVLGSLTFGLIITRTQLWYSLPGDWLSANPTPPPVWPVAVPVATPGIIARQESIFNPVAARGEVVGISRAEKRELTLSTTPFTDAALGTDSVSESLFVNVGSKVENALFGRHELEPRALSKSKPPTQRIPWLSNPAWMAKKDPSILNQLRTFVICLSSIMDPFNTNGVPLRFDSPSYDSGALWTIPVEWSGSMITFVVVLVLSWAKPWPKLFLLISFAAWGYHTGRGVLTQFVSGIILAEISLVRGAWEKSRAELPQYGDDASDGLFNYAYNAVNRYLGPWRHLAVTGFWTSIFLIGLFLGSYPYAKGENSIGWTTITTIMKKNQIDVNSQHLYFTGSILIVASLNNCATLQRIFTTRIAQYLGRVSFSVYLLHMQILWTVGTRVFPFCMQIVGGGETSQIRFMIAMLLGGAIVFPVQFWVSDVFCRAIDEKSIVFTKWLAEKLLDFGGKP